MKRNPKRISRHALALLACNVVSPRVFVNQTVTLLSLFLCVSAFWECCVVPSPQRLASRCWQACRPNSDPAGWMPGSGPSPRGTQRSHPPAPPQSPAAPAPAPEMAHVAKALKKNNPQSHLPTWRRTWSSCSLSGGGWGAWPLGVGGADGGRPDDRGRVTVIPPSFLWYSIGDWRAEDTNVWRFLSDLLKYEGAIASQMETRRDSGSRCFDGQELE